MPGAPIDYRSAGVDYQQIDALKVQAQQAARATARHLAGHGVHELERSRGESAYVMEVGGRLLASVTECLGTKALVADATRPISGRTHYDSIAQDTIAMAVNDLLTVGATPLAVQAYWAAGSSEWFADAERMRDLIAGWQAACEQCRVSWGGGETPALNGVVAPERIDLAASCLGVIEPRERLLLGEQLAPGDAIVLFGSSGIHANGVTLARRVAERLAAGYGARLEDGRRFGEALLDPTILYASVMERFWAGGGRAHYCVNITGHGWRKLMRHPQSLTYRISLLPPVPAVLRFLQREAALDDHEAYGSLNMGAGFALFVPPDQAGAALSAARAAQVPAWVAGHVEPGPRRVVIEPLRLSYDAHELELRA
ncbi:MAG TPA: AIR synthase related protein [Steroidobacteraceae bacterium]|nr:AIR synthase related protein [Steroidobacteraceae bacterium]